MAPFTEHRPLLFSIAYEILGSVTDAEDAVQDAFVKWAAVDHASIENPRAYTAQIVTREALGRLRSAARQRETYVGPWLPEPLATTDFGNESSTPLDHVLTGEAVTTAMLLVLETLTPVQRAVFVLREVFEFGYPEIAEAVGKNEAAVRQLNQRARNSVHARRKSAIASPAEAEAASALFAGAIATGDIQALMDMLAPDVVFLADGGGKVVGTVQRPVYGPANVARLMVGLLAKGQRMGDLEVRFGVYNGMHSALVLIDGTLDQVTSFEVTENGLISTIYCSRNPDKLKAVTF